MSDGFFGRHRILLFRSYLFLVAGLLLVAALLDFGFGRLQSQQRDPEEPWLSANFRLIEAELLEQAPGDRAAAAAMISEQSGVPIRLLAADDVAARAPTDAPFETLIDADENLFYLRHSPALNGHIRLGPVAAEQESPVLKLLPTTFYLSIFVIVGLWLRPLFKDLNLLTSASQRFAADYREPLDTADRTNQLTELASNLDDMSTRLSGLIQSQKELIAALSHEMRTPLARIRMALAVMNDKGDSEARRQLDDVVQDVEEIDQLIGTMLSYARLDHPDLRMHWLEVPIAPWADRLQQKCGQPDKALNIVIDESLDTVAMDPRLMELALSNLLANGNRYARQQVKCNISPSAAGYRVTVEDDGSGIPESEREAIFKAFSRIDDSRNRDTGGYGLGLAIVARIAALHGGSVSVSSSAALGGARFDLRWAPPA